MNLSPQQQQKLHRLKTDLPYYAANNLKIIPKEGGIIPLNFNFCQNFLHSKFEEQLQRTGRVRVIVLKGRQQTCSTYVAARFYHKANFTKGLKTSIVTHDSKATNNLFSVPKRFHDNSLPFIRPELKASNVKELTFAGMETSYNVFTAGASEIGRSMNNHLLHCSEVAFWENAENHTKSIMQTVGDFDGTEVVLESTANGIGNYFHAQCQLAMRGESEFEFIFMPWWWTPEYTKAVPAGFELTEEEARYKELYELSNEQMAWRRGKIQEFMTNAGDINSAINSFRQEYPANPDEAFIVTSGSAFIPAEFVLDARKRVNCGDFGSYVVGVDPNMMGNDACGIYRRQGNKAFKPEMHKDKNPMQLVGILANILRNEPVDMMFIDQGEGGGIFYRLQELGFTNVTLVPFGSASSDPSKFKNKRAEMWFLMREWLRDSGQLVDHHYLDLVQSEIASPFFVENSSGTIQLESKIDMKKRGVMSPNLADALCLTFAFPVKSKEITSMINREAIYDQYEPYNPHSYI